MPRRFVHPIPERGAERVQAWQELYHALADDADAQRVYLAKMGGDEWAAEMVEYAYRARLHELLDYAIDRREWTPDRREWAP